MFIVTQDTPRFSVWQGVQMEHTGQSAVYGILRLLQTLPMDFACLVVRPCVLILLCSTVVQTCMMRLGWVLFSLYSCKCIMCTYFFYCRSCYIWSWFLLQYKDFLIVLWMQVVQNRIWFLRPISPSVFCFCRCGLMSMKSPWYDLCGWLGVKNQLSMYLMPTKTHLWFLATVFQANFTWWDWRLWLFSDAHITKCQEVCAKSWITAVSLQSAPLTSI